MDIPIMRTHSKINNGNMCVNRLIAVREDDWLQNPLLKKLIRRILCAKELGARNWALGRRTWLIGSFLEPLCAGAL